MAKSPCSRSPPPWRSPLPRRPRVADLATNIAEGVVFVVEGKTIKHHAEG